MIHWGIGKIIDIHEETSELQIVMVAYEEKGKKDKGVLTKAIHYISFFPALKVGDTVLLNKTAKTLQLGTGGVDFVAIPYHIFLNNPEYKRESRFIREGHIMKLRYTPFQFSIKSCEEEESQFHHVFTEEKTIRNLHVIVGELHSMLPIIVTIFRQLEILNKNKPKKIVYIMTDGAALPISFSQQVTNLKRLGWLNHTITIGQAFGGDLEAVNIYTALIAAKHIYDADFVIVLMGPGIVGTGTLLGHTGIEQGEIINAVKILEGKPVAIIRASSADQRERQWGISHHTVTNLTKISLVESILPYPSIINESYPQILDSLNRIANKKEGINHELTEVFFTDQQLKDLLAAYPHKITTMGRNIEQDPLFFQFVASSAFWIYETLHSYYINKKEDDEG